MNVFLKKGETVVNAKELAALRAKAAAYDEAAKAAKPAAKPVTTTPRGGGR